MSACPAEHWEPGELRHVMYGCIRDPGHAGQHRDDKGREWGVLPENQPPRLTDLVARLPWVTRLDATQPCAAYRWSCMSLKDLDDPTWMDTWKCHNCARWQFEGLPLQKRAAYPQAGSGVYCWQHLLIQFRLNAREEARYEREIAKLRAA